MSARRKKGSPMKYRGFYCPDELWQEMQRCAEIADESDSEYIRKAIEMRNKQYNRGGMMLDPATKNLSDDELENHKTFTDIETDLPNQKPVKKVGTIKATVDNNTGKATCRTFFKSK